MDDEKFEKIMDTWASHEIESAPELHPTEEMSRMLGAKKRKRIFPVYMRWATVGVAVTALIVIAILHPDLFRSSTYRHLLTGKKELSVGLRKGFAAEKGILVKESKRRGPKKGTPRMGVVFFEQAMLHFQKKDSRFTEAVDLQTPQPERIKLTSDGNYQLFFELADDRYVYVFQLDSSGNLVKIFPNKIYSSVGNPLRKGQTYFLPSKPNWFYLGENPGEERIYIISSLQPIPDYEKLYTQYDKAKDSLEKQKIIVRFLKKIESVVKDRGEEAVKLEYSFGHQ